MAWPIINSPFLPSIADVPALPPKLKEMPVFNPGVSTYICEDGVTRVMTEEQAINLGISCKVVDEQVAPAVVWPGTVLLAGQAHTGPRYRSINRDDRRVVRRF